nr:translation initiation factor IF-2 isoform X2 [Vulpes vulpes]
MKQCTCEREKGSEKPAGTFHGSVTEVCSSPGSPGLEPGRRHVAAAHLQQGGDRAPAGADRHPALPGLLAQAAVARERQRAGARAGAVLVALGLVLRGPALQPAPRRLLPDGAGVARVDHAVPGERAGAAHGRARRGALRLPVRHGRVRRLPAVAPQPVGPLPVRREPRAVLAARLQRLPARRHQQRGGVQAAVRAAALRPGAGGLPRLQPRGAQGGALLQPAGALLAAAGPRAQPAHRAPGARPAGRAALARAVRQGAGARQRHRAGHQRHVGGGRPRPARGARGVPQPRAHRRGRHAEAAALPAGPLPPGAFRGSGAGAAA